MQTGRTSAGRVPPSDTPLFHEFIRRGASLSLLRRYFNASQMVAGRAREQLSFFRPPGRGRLPSFGEQLDILALWQDRSRGPSDVRNRLIWVHEQSARAYSLSIIVIILKKMGGVVGQ